MIKRAAQGLALTVTGLITLALWRWRSVRQKRKPAPLAASLIQNPDTDVSLIRQKDTLTIRWLHPTQRAEIYIGDAYQPLAHKTPDMVVNNQQMAVVQGINPKQRYKVIIQTDDNTLLTQTERTIPLESAPNFRDIGGYITQDGRAVRWNRIYRSSALDQLSETDLQTVKDLNIQLVCDVRTQEEHKSDPDKLPDDIQVISTPPSSDDSVMLSLFRLFFQHGFLEHLLGDLYQRVMIQDNPQVFRDIFQSIADDSNLPMVIHCAAGKDRTGITVALLLAFLGVPDEVIVADYSLSNHHYTFFKEATRKNLAQLRIVGLTESDFDYLLIANADEMQQTLDFVRQEYGSIENYLSEYVGLPHSTLQRIRENLLV